MLFIFDFKGLKKHSHLSFYHRFSLLLLIFFIWYQKTFWTIVIKKQIIGYYWN